MLKALKQTFQITIFITVSSTSFAQDQTCSQMAEQFFLKEMDGIVGENAPEVIKRPKYIKLLMEKIKSEYPNSDLMTCMNEGLDAAKLSKKRLQERSVSII